MIATALAPTRARVRGSHRFTDARLAGIAAESGLEDAWLAGFERNGVDVLKAVSGEFSVFLQDSHGRSFAAVDRFGSHSLCYRFEGGQLLAGERAHEVAPVGVTLDQQAIFDFLYFHVIPAPRTIFEGVKRLPLAHYAMAENGSLVTRQWWKPSFVEDAEIPFDELRQEFNALLRQAVSCRLDGRSTGAFLSGGTDSSTIAGLVTGLTGGPAKTFSIGFDATGYDEMDYARIAARHFGTDHHEYYVGPDDIVSAIPGIAASYDQPFGNSSVLPTYYCARIAREHGVDLLLAGDGGDELFGGNSRYAKQRLFEAYRLFPSPLRGRVIEPMLKWRGVQSVPGMRKAASYVEQARVALPDRLEMYNLIVRIGLMEILEPAFLAEIDVVAPARQQRETYAATAAAGTINRMLAYDWKFTLADNDLPKVRGAAAHAGVEVGFPFLDERLVDFSLRLSPHLKLKGSQLRWFFKEALRGFLPDEILAKRKHGFGLPFGVWLTKHRHLRELAFDSLQSLRQRGIVRGDFIQRLTDEYLPQHPGYYGELVWILMTLELWLSGARPHEPRMNCLR
jgi:asparagine synthase (glutamine-hydrolysing)